MLVVKKKGFPASYTVELALLVPVLLLALLGSIYMVMHFHNSASLQAGACEIAVTGKADTTIPPLLFSPSAAPNISENAASRSVSFDSYTAWYGGETRTLSRNARYEVSRPVTAMNLVRAGKKAVGVLEEEEG